MGVSYFMLPKIVVQNDKASKEAILERPLDGNPDFSKNEDDNKYPTLKEIYESIEKAQIKIEYEDRSLDEFKLKNGKREIVHSMGITDNEMNYSFDFTMRYPEAADENHRITTLMGIKSRPRILIKLFSAISKKCGSYFICNPYESYFIDKEKSFEEIWHRIQTNWNNE
ncbi:MAG: hypothetical protein AAFZ15_34200 [Bacteroidota bacterium]